MEWIKRHWCDGSGRVDNMYWLTIKLHVLKLFDKIRGSE